MLNTTCRRCTSMRLFLCLYFEQAYHVQETRVDRISPRTPACLSEIGCLLWSAHSDSSNRSTAAHYDENRVEAVPASHFRMQGLKA